MTGPKRYSNQAYRRLRAVKRFGLYAGVAIVLAYMLFPYYWAIISSTKSRASLYSFSLLPSLDFSNYISLFNNPIFMGAIVNSAIVAFSSSLISLIISLLAAYALGRLHFPVSRIILICVLMISVFPQVVVLSGMFEVIGWLDFYNRPAALIFSYLLLILPFTTWVLTSFIRDLPTELEEAALIDGCSRIRILTHVLLPLMGPAIASTGLLAFILAWNEFLFALTFILTDENRTVPVAIGLLTGSSRYEYPFGQIMAASVTVTLPLLILVLIFQRKIVAGLTAGAVKG
ncbi:sugar ABC transporter permease [Phyllobacterium brassicacearum]|uniref:Sugar ABC transporter permease n=1 Tax=Phyllobacterium brassicacearum TaxID=314235 RepID=A0A2P7BV02_9HYPH|nr:carbohydrate ABC transporter permease [Phyllobacterium brassicacearum]PSH70297.1 sugar ABC transporter permease [Phyllobacterium brassicacearum]TDQ28132.1 carbohydrate ABC transporter membrane protein 2 (CUT1 family) [Phyllobacterium brassicacearum]